MSQESNVTVFTLGKYGKHPKADNLSIVSVFGCPCIFRSDTGYQTGDRLVYVPVDTMVPTDRPEFSWLADRAKKTGEFAGMARIGAMRLRGIFSMGILAHAPAGLEPGQDASTALGCRKYVASTELNPRLQGLVEACPIPVPVYDIEGARNFGHLFNDGEEVVITEKIHGCNARFVHDGTRLWVGSRTQFKKDQPGVVWWDVAEDYNLASRLSSVPGMIFFGEIYGKGIQDLHYSEQGRSRLVIFDVMDSKTRTYLDVDALGHMLQAVNLPVPPVLYRGPYSKDLLALAEGPTTLAWKNEQQPPHVREGIVIRPIKERYDIEIGRVQLKLAGEGYLTRKGADL